jgi:hypothetical protein
VPNLLMWLFLDGVQSEDVPVHVVYDD